jgi:hypothetical protein
MRDGYVSRHADRDVIGRARQLVRAPVERVVPVEITAASIPGNGEQSATLERFEYRRSAAARTDLGGTAICA